MELIAKGGDPNYTLWFTSFDFYVAGLTSEF